MTSSSALLSVLSSALPPELCQLSFLVGGSDCCQECHESSAPSPDAFRQDPSSSISSFDDLIALQLSRSTSAAADGAAAATAKPASAEAGWGLGSQARNEALNSKCFMVKTASTSKEARIILPLAAPLRTWKFVGVQRVASPPRRMTRNAWFRTSDSLQSGGLLHAQRSFL